MKNKKTFACLLLSMSLFCAARPAYAVVELMEVLQQSLRNVQAVLEVVKNVASLEKSIQQTNLQGLIGAVSPQVADLGSKIKGQDFAPVLPPELQGVVSGSGLKAVPQIRSYVEKDLASMNIGDGVSQRDVLHKISEMQNLTAVDAIKYGKEALAKSNKASGENKSQLAVVGNAKDWQSKMSQETGVAIKTLKNDVFRNQMAAGVLHTKAMHYKANLMKAVQSDDVTHNIQNSIDNGGSNLEQLKGAFK